MSSKNLKTLRICLVLLFSVLPVFYLATALRASVLVSGGGWPQSVLTLRERDLIFEAVKTMPFSRVAPTLLRALVDLRPSYGINPYGKRPWNSNRYTNRDKNYVLAEELWAHHLARPVDPAKADVLVDLLRASTRSDEKIILSIALQNSIWTPKAAPLLAAIAADSHETLRTRGFAINTLLRCDDVNRHMPMAIEIVLASPTIGMRCQNFAWIATDPVRGNAPLNRESRERLVSAGFEILTALPEKNWSWGYHAASKLGRLLDIKDEFCPNQKDPAYRQGKNGGLTDVFFTDTVKNALAWNRERACSSVLQP